jgi:hypothetical protein
MDIWRAVYKTSEESGVVEEPPDNMERATAVASQAYGLLRIWNRVPGTGEKAMIDGAALESWVKEARILAERTGREEIADQKIGEILSASPAGDDGIWPAIPVREVIEIVRSSHLETGFVIGRPNRQGVTTRSPRDGGAQDRALVNQYREFVRATALG